VCTILFVDDHDDVQEAVGEALREGGHEVRGAKNGSEALLLLAIQPEEPPCLILLDLMMPVMDGWDFLERLRREPRWAKLPVIVVSSSIQKSAPRPVLRAQAFWSKPIDIEQLEQIHMLCPTHYVSEPPQESADPTANVG
jgi:CheY-like chemotaxis protein